MAYVSVQTKKEIVATGEKIMNKGLLTDGYVKEKNYFSVAVFKNASEVNSHYCCLTYYDGEYSIEYFNTEKEIDAQECGTFKTATGAVNKIVKKLGA
ncbi:hypothetical protein V7094_28560 [Priestia megaterium]|uniref:hypothetical protein n=1 Tax=Priestia megaterium TaxID=1404 RepID=UPI0030009D13